jgi:decaprenylphospho-beta-D-ribofuranose 2-oxidase
MKQSWRSGWGQNIQTKVHYSLLNPADSFRELSESSISAGLAVGLGRSYGDSSLNSHGVTWTTEALKQIEIFPEHGYAVCGSGVTIGQLERAASKHALFPPVVPGTEFVTIGGAIASNVHGKSHHSDGSFGDNVLELTLVSSQGEQKVMTPEGENADEFWATVGGMGLTGAIVKAKIRLKPVETNFFLVEEIRVKDLNEMLCKLEYFDSKYSHTVAWIDLSRSYFARGIVGGGKFATLSELKNSYIPFPEKLPGNVSLPKTLPFSIINNNTVGIFNSFWYRKPLKRGLMHFQPFLHPLDSIKNWNGIYGRRGFLQYQFVVPFGKESLLFDFVDLMRFHKVTSFLTVLKRLHTKNSRFLSFPISGWTLAVDFSANEESFISALNAFDEKLTEVGGRIYLTKDSRVSKEHFQRMYPQVEDWRAIRNSLDPNNYWKSDQGRRLGLC